MAQTGTEFMRDAALHLKWRRVSHDTLRRAIQVLAEADRQGDSLEDRFGSPTTYAETFDRGRTLYPGYLLASAIAFLSVMLLGATAFNGLVLRHTQEFPNVAYLVGLCILAAALGFMAGSALDRHLPRTR